MCAEDAMRKWYYSVWNKYLLNEHLYNYENGGYLLLDKATSLMTSNIITLLRIHNREVSFIPTELTRFLKPLNFVINKPFKQALKEKYIDFCIKMVW